jgi:hypothetical protein
MNRRILAATFSLAASCAFAQPKRPVQAQSPSSVAYTVKDGVESVEITNSVFEFVVEPRLLLRKTTKTKDVFDDEGIEASTTVEAWPLGTDLKQKPAYSLTVQGIDPRVVNGELLVILRGLEETEWWTAYRVADGQRLFDTYVPLVAFSIARDTVTQRYAGLEVPEDDIKDTRLRAPNVVGVVTYASGGKVIREALITADDPKRAALLRSFADASRTLSYGAGSLRLSISQNYPSAPATVSITIPVAKDDLDLAKAQLPPGLHAVAFKR